MDLHYSQTFAKATTPQNSFTTLWIYTILKLKKDQAFRIEGFTTLWIYTILKLYYSTKYGGCQFYYLMDLHYSQTNLI